MKTWFLTMAIGMIIKILMKQAPEMVKKFWDSLREKAKAYVEGTDNTADDWIYKCLFEGGEDVKKLADMVLDFGEDYILGSTSKLDDVLFLPVFAMIRSVANIPEFDEIPDPPVVASLTSETHIDCPDVIEG